MEFYKFRTEEIWKKCSHSVLDHNDLWKSIPQTPSSLAAIDACLYNLISFSVAGILKEKFIVWQDPVNKSPDSRVGLCLKMSIELELCRV